MVDSKRNSGIRLTLLDVLTFIAVILAMTALAVAFTGCDDSSQPLDNVDGGEAAIVADADPHGN